MMLCRRTKAWFCFSLFSFLFFSEFLTLYTLCFSENGRNTRERRQVEKLRSYGVQEKKINLIKFQCYYIFYAYHMWLGCVLSRYMKKSEKETNSKLVKKLYYWHYCGACFNLFEIDLSTMTATCVQTAIIFCLAQCFILRTSIPASTLALLQYIFHTAKWTFVNGKQTLHLPPSRCFPLLRKKTPHNYDLHTFMSRPCWRLSPHIHVPPPSTCPAWPLAYPVLTQVRLHECL